MLCGEQRSTQLLLKLDFWFVIIPIIMGHILVYNIHFQFQNFLTKFHVVLRDFILIVLNSCYDYYFRNIVDVQFTPPCYMQLLQSNLSVSFEHRLACWFMYPLSIILYLFNLYYYLCIIQIQIYYILLISCKSF